jgi:hypothetical protein
MKRNYLGNKWAQFKKAEYKLVRTIDRRTKLGKDIEDNGDVPVAITLDDGSRVWSFA